MLYPLKFQPFLKFYPYGGRRLVNLLHKENVPVDRDVAESWEIADHGEEQSVVVNGSLQGKTLRQLMEEYKSELVGKEIYDRYGDYFPLLLKFLDCDKRLPAHLHPSDADAKKMGLNDTGKAEAWYIFKADPGAGAYCGSLPGLTPEKFSDAIARNDNFDGVMNYVSTQTGHTYLVPPGRLHSIDAGNLAIEIQQNSDAGFGWDWQGFVEAGVIDPVDAENHKKWAPQTALYEDGAQQHTRIITLSQGNVTRTFCAVCQYFALEKLVIAEPYEFQDNATRFNTFTITDGKAEISGNGESTFAKLGESLLIPAGTKTFIKPADSQPVEILRCYVPDIEKDIVDPLRLAGYSDVEIAWLGSYGERNDLQQFLELPDDWDQQ
jgi:mannose-6-phosphate isomerase